MKTNEVFPSKYLKAEDDTFASGDVTVTIKGVAIEKLTSREKGEENKPVMFFNELPKGLIVNKTNWGICEKLFASDDSDDWLNERVALTTVDVDAFGDVVRAIRIKSQKPKADKSALIERYTKLWERGKKINLDNIDSYVITPNMDEQEIKDLGVELRRKVEAAENF